LIEYRYEVAMEPMRMFKLRERRRSNGGPSHGVACDEDGIFLGDLALAAPEMEESGRRFYRTRSLDEINRLLSIGYGTLVDFTSRMPGLRQAAKYLSEGEWVLAQIAAVQLCLPDLPDDVAAIRMRKAEGRLRRFNPNHYPANSGRGGQFAPAAQNGAPSGRDPSQGDSSGDAADIASRKFGNEVDAARFALRRFYAESKRADVEYAGVIYRNKDGSYGVTLPSTAADGNTNFRSVTRWDQIPQGTERVASYHTHLEANHGLAAGQNEQLSIGDQYIAQHNQVRSYIATPSGRLKVYDGRTRQERDLGRL
jgi:Domain of unknown function (DUF4329)